MQLRIRPGFISVQVKQGQKRPGVTLAGNPLVNEGETHQVMSETINRASQLGKSRENGEPRLVMRNLVRTGTV